MPTDSKPVSPASLKIEQPEEGVFSCYSNHIQITWRAQDIQLIFGEVSDASEEVPSQFTPRLERRAIVTLSWIQAKQIVNLVNGTITKFEQLNGITIPNVEDIKIP